MFVKEKVIACVGRTLDKLGEKERKSYKCAVCPVFGFQPKRPDRTSNYHEKKQVNNE